MPEEVESVTLIVPGYIVESELGRGGMGNDRRNINLGFRVACESD